MSTSRSGSLKTANGDARVSPSSPMATACSLHVRDTGDQEIDVVCGQFADGVSPVGRGAGKRVDPAVEVAHTSPVTDPFDLSDTPWSNPEAELLTGGEDWWFVACMDWPRDEWLGYIEGYRKAAALILAQVAATGRDQDYVVYPFLMCWRQHVELVTSQVAA